VERGEAYRYNERKISTLEKASGGKHCNAMHKNSRWDQKKKSNKMNTKATKAPAHPTPRKGYYTGVKKKEGNKMGIAKDQGRESQ